MNTQSLHFKHFYITCVIEQFYIYWTFVCMLILIYFPQIFIVWKRANGGAHQCSGLEKMVRQLNAAA